MKISNYITAALVGISGLWGTAYAEDPIKIGSVLSITGATSFLGEPEDKTLRMYVQAINSKGGVLGRPLELTAPSSADFFSV